VEVEEEAYSPLAEETTQGSARVLEDHLNISV
jgi:hypothetical protein